MVLSLLQQCAMKNLPMCLLIISRDGMIVEMEAMANDDNFRYLKEVFEVNKNILEADINEDVILGMLEEERGEFFINGMKYLFRGCEFTDDEQGKHFRSVVIVENEQDMTPQSVQKLEGQILSVPAKTSPLLDRQEDESKKRVFELSTQSSNSEEILHLNASGNNPSTNDVSNPEVPNQVCSTIIDQIPCGVILVDGVTGIVRKVNCCAMWLDVANGKKFETSLDKMRNKIFHSKDIDRLILLNHECKLEYKLYNAFDHSITMKTLAGKLVSFVCRPSTIFPPKSAAPKQQPSTIFVWTIVDVTNMVVEDKNSAVLECMQHTSHDMRTPMQAIMLAAHALKENMQEGESRFNKHAIQSCSDSVEEGKTFADSMGDLETIISSGCVLEGIMSNILELKAIQSTTLSPNPVPFNVKENITKIVDMLKSSTLVFEGVSLSCSFDPIIENLSNSLIFDKVMFNRIIQNLVSNALKFTNKGSVNVTCSLKKASSGGHYHHHHHHHHHRSEQNNPSDCNDDASDSDASTSCTDDSSSSIASSNGFSETSPLDWQSKYEQKNDLRLRIKITDTGCGMDDTLQQKVKETNIGAREELKKFGLGTLIVTAYVQALGGKISFDSKLGKGTIVTLDMPTRFSSTECVMTSNSVVTEEINCSEPSHNVISSLSGECATNEPPSLCEPEEVRRVSSPDSNSRGSRSISSVSDHEEEAPKICRHEESWEEEGEEEEEEEEEDLVLVVEDTTVNRKLIVRSLERGGFKVHQAENGAVALDMMCKNRYRTVFMDINMPIMNGDDAIREYWRDYHSKAATPIEPALEQAKLSGGRRKKLHAPPRIVILTGNITETDRKKALACGADDFLTKPVVPNQLLEAASLKKTNQ